MSKYLLEYYNHERDEWRVEYHQFMTDIIYKIESLYLKTFTVSERSSLYPKQLAKILEYENGERLETVAIPPKTLQKFKLK